MTRLNAARRFLWGSLVAAPIHFLTIVGHYHRHSANLFKNTMKKPGGANFEATAAKMRNIMAVQVSRLDYSGRNALVGN